MPEVPDNTAVRTALWRALHVQIDPPPHILEDLVGLELAAPPEGWQERGDMHPEGTRRFRTSIVVRARFIEDLVQEQAESGVSQYVILGAGLDTFVQRRPDMASKVTVFEIDQPETQAWKRQRLIDLGYGVPEWLTLVPVDFEKGDSWPDRLAEAGFDKSKPAVVASTGVSMYLTREANATTLRQIAELAPGSTLAMTFMKPIEMAASEDKAGVQGAAAGARASGTPFISFYTPEEMLAAARDAGFKRVQHISGIDLTLRYFANRSDGLQPSPSEEILIAKT